MAEPAKRLATYADINALPPHLVGEIIDGELYAMPRPGLPNEAFFSMPPDWVCEVLSPSTQGYDRARKLTVYLREQVPYVWLLDPLARLLEVFEFSGRFYARIAACIAAQIVRLPPYEEAELPLGMLWADTQGET